MVKRQMRNFCFMSALLDKTKRSAGNWRWRHWLWLHANKAPRPGLINFGQRCSYDHGKWQRSAIDLRGKTSIFVRPSRWSIHLNLMSCRMFWLSKGVQDTMSIMTAYPSAQKVDHIQDLCSPCLRLHFQACHTSRIEQSTITRLIWKKVGQVRYFFHTPRLPLVEAYIFWYNDLLRLKGEN